jgi:HEPN domain-containing protein
VADYDKVSYWIEMSEYDFATAKWMFRVCRYLYVGFMCHQAIEKMLKAKVVENRPLEQLPYSHKLVEIATKGGIFDKQCRIKHCLHGIISLKTRSSCRLRNDRVAY